MIKEEDLVTDESYLGVITFCTFSKFVFMRRTRMFNILVGNYEASRFTGIGMLGVRAGRRGTHEGKLL